MAIKKLLFYLVCIFTIGVGAVWMIMSQEAPVKIKTEAPVKRTLAYQQAVTQPREEPKKDGEGADIPAFETVTTEDGTTPAGDPSAIQTIPAPPDGNTPPDMAALPGAGTPVQDPTGQDPTGATPGQSEPLPWATDQAEQWGDERRQEMQDQAYGRPAQPGQPYGQQDNPAGPPPGEPYGQQGDPYGPPPGGAYGEDGSYDPYAAPRDPYAAQRDPYTQGDPYAGQAGGAPQQQWGGQPGGPPGEQWVQVVGSGSGMRATATIDAPILFAFPYGRQLKVVSRNAEWVEVTDPNSSATGWMPAHALAPSAGPNAPGYGQEQAYQEEQPKRRGLFRRGGFGDMINRAFGN